MPNWTTTTTTGLLSPTGSCVGGWGRRGGDATFGWRRRGFRSRCGKGIWGWHTPQQRGRGREKKKDEKQISQEIRLTIYERERNTGVAGMLKDKSLGKSPGKANAAYRCQSTDIKHFNEWQVKGQMGKQMWQRSMTNTAEEASLVSRLPSAAVFIWQGLIDLLFSPLKEKHVCLSNTHVENGSSGLRASHRWVWGYTCLQNAKCLCYNK